jgi:DNA-binding SARP family transcriptional activator
VEFRLLGPLEVTGATGTPCALEPRHARLLAVLLLAANRVVTREQLIEAIWDDQPPPTVVRRGDIPITPTGNAATWQ